MYWTLVQQSLNVPELLKHWCPATTSEFPMGATAVAQFRVNKWSRSEIRLRIPKFRQVPVSCMRDVGKKLDAGLTKPLGGKSQRVVAPFFIADEGHSFGPVSSRTLLAELLQRGAPAENARQLGQPDADVDLIKRRIAQTGHVSSLLYRRPQRKQSNQKNLR